MGASRIRWYDREHKGNSFSDTEQVIGKLEEKGKLAGQRYRNECSHVLTSEPLLVHSLQVSREF